MLQDLASRKEPDSALSGGYFELLLVAVREWHA
jgi:hypothetical protein